jgi:hypothetical protein
MTAVVENASGKRILMKISKTVSPQSKITPMITQRGKNTSCHIRSLAVIFGSYVPELWAQFSGFADASRMVIAMISGFERF